MATETLALTAEVAAGWTVIAGANAVAAVALPDDDATSNIGSGIVAGTVETFSAADSVAIHQADTISNVQIVARTKRATSSTTYTPTITVGGSSTDGASTSAPGVYTTATFDFALQPNGSAWTLATVNALNVSIRNNGILSVLCTTFYVIVTYTVFKQRRDPLLLMGVG